MHSQIMGGSTLGLFYINEVINNGNKCNLGGFSVPLGLSIVHQGKKNTWCYSSQWAKLQAIPKLLVLAF